MINITWRAETEQVKQLFGRFVGRVKNPRPVLEGPILARLRQLTRRNFASEGALATPSPWKPLGKRALEVSDRIGMLRVTDRLFSSLTEDTSDAIAEVSPDGRTLNYGSRVFYFPKHQEGIGIPKRQPVPDPLPDQVQRQIRSDMREWVLRGTLRGGGRQ